MITRPERSPFRKITRVSFNFGVWNVHRQRGYPLPIFIDFVIIPRQDVILVAVNVSRKRPQNMALSRGIMISKESKKKIFEVLCFPFFAEENCRSAPRNLPAVEVDVQRNATSAAVMWASQEQHLNFVSMLHQPRKPFNRRRRIWRASMAVLLQRQKLLLVEVHFSKPSTAVLLQRRKLLLVEVHFLRQQPYISGVFQFVSIFSLMRENRKVAWSSFLEGLRVNG